MSAWWIPPPEPRSQHLGDVGGCFPRRIDLLAYGLKEGGADEYGIHVFDVKTKKTLEDELPAARYFGVEFAPDGKSLYYARNNKQGTLLFQHVLGTRAIAGCARLRARIPG